MPSCLRTLSLVILAVFLMQGCAMTVNGVSLPPFRGYESEPARRKVGDKKEIDISLAEVILVLSVPIVLTAASIAASMWISNEIWD